MPFVVTENIDRDINQLVYEVTCRDLINAGLDGIEVDHRDHSPDEKSALIKLAVASAKFDSAVANAPFA